MFTMVKRFSLLLPDRKILRRNVL